MRFMRRFAYIAFKNKFFSHETTKIQELNNIFCGYNRGLFNSDSYKTIPYKIKQPV